MYRFGLVLRFDASSTLDFRDWSSACCWRRLDRYSIVLDLAVYNSAKIHFRHKLYRGPKLCHSSGGKSRRAVVGVYKCTTFVVKFFNALLKRQVACVLVNDALERLRVSGVYLVRALSAEAATPIQCDIHTLLSSMFVAFC